MNPLLIELIAMTVISSQEGRAGKRREKNGHWGFMEFESLNGIPEPLTR